MALRLANLALCQRRMGIPSTTRLRHEREITPAKADGSRNEGSAEIGLLDTAKLHKVFSRSGCGQYVHAQAVSGCLHCPIVVKQRLSRPSGDLASLVSTRVLSRSTSIRSSSLCRLATASEDLSPRSAGQLTPTSADLLRVSWPSPSKASLYDRQDC